MKFICFYHTLLLRRLKIIESTLETLANSIDRLDNICILSLKEHASASSHLHDNRIESNSMHKVIDLKEGKLNKDTANSIINQ